MKLTWIFIVLNFLFAIANFICFAKDQYLFNFAIGIFNLAVTGLLIYGTIIGKKYGNN